MGGGGGPRPFLQEITKVVIAKNKKLSKKKHSSRGCSVSKGGGGYIDLLTRNYQSSSLISKQFVKQFFYFLIVLNLCLIPVFVYLQKIVDCG